MLNTDRYIKQVDKVKRIWSLSNIRGYKGPICGFDKILKYAEIATDKWKLGNESANYYIQYLDEELLSKE